MRNQLSALKAKKFLIHHNFRIHRLINTIPSPGEKPFKDDSLSLSIFPTSQQQKFLIPKQQLLADAAEKNLDLAFCVCNFFLLLCLLRFTVISSLGHNDNNDDDVCNIMMMMMMRISLWWC